MTPDWTDGEKILQSIKEDSKHRRENPIKTFCEFLEAIWMDNTEQEALVQWNIKVEQAPWYAKDVLDCLNQIIENPPSNLIGLLSVHGWISLYHEEGSTEEYTYDEYVNWLKNLRDQYEDIYEKV
jgi:hypothetical protein